MVTIREATTEDAAVLNDMVRELAGHEDSLDHVHADVKGWQDLLSRPEVTILLAEDDRDAVGFASTVRRVHLWSARDLLELDDLYVRSSHRDRGVGSRLMKAVAELASEDRLTVRWGVRLDNHSAQRFYSRLGATLTTKMTASWTPDRYHHHLLATIGR
jgi:ribosomal protein S18 acetylase RimI-like enzyme